MDEDDITLESNNEDGEEIDASKAVAKLKKVKQELKVCQTEKQDYLETLQRLKADFVNFRKGQEGDQTRAANAATENILKELLALSDSFGVAFTHDAWASASASWKQGIEGISGQLESIFKRYEVTEIKALNEPFDPVYHQALGTLDAATEKEDNLVLEVLQKGYLMGDKVLRPALVKVGAHN